MWKFGESILRACAAMASRTPWLVILVSLVLAAAAGYAATGLSVNTSTEEILAAELPFRQVELAYKQHFPEEELAVVVVDAPSSEEADAAAGGLVDRLQKRPELFERVDFAGASPYFDRYGLLFLDVEALRSLGAELAQARRLLTVLASDPSLRGLARLVAMAEGGVAEGSAPETLANLLNDLADVTERRADGQPAEVHWSGIFDVEAADQGTRRLVEIKPVLDNSSLDRAGPALEALGAEIAAVTAERQGITMRVTGEPVLRQQELNDAFSGAIKASGLSFVLVALSLIIGIRSGRLIAALLITLVIGSLWTTGLAALVVGRLNLISVAFLVLFFGLGVDFGTHLGLRHLEEVRKGASFQDALKTAMMGEGPSIFLSALCASLAFLAFVPTSYTGLAEFGIISALGMLAAVVATFTLQPALMAVMPPRAPKGAGISFGIGGWIKRSNRLILIAAVVASVVAAYLAKDAWLDVNPLNLQNPNSEPVQTYHDLASDPDTSPYALNALAPNLDAARELAPKLAAVQGVAGVRWIEDFVPQDQPAKLVVIEGIRTRLGERFFDPAAVEPPPDDAALAEAFAKLRASAAAIGAAPGGVPALNEAGNRFAAALDLFAERRGTEPDALRELGTALTGNMPPLVADLRQKLSVAEPVGLDAIPPELSRNWVAEDGTVRISVMPAEDISDKDDLETFATRVAAVTPNAAGVPATITGAGEAILNSFVSAIAYTVISIALVVMVLRRRVSDVLLVLAPLAVAALWTVAASATLNLPFNFANIIVVPLLIGLGVASSIHIVVRSHEVVHDKSGTHEEGMDVLDTSTPLAVLVAQLNTVAAFATLAVSEHRGLFSMGVLLGLAILFVMIVSLVVLPAFMMILTRRNKATGAGA